MSPAIHFIPRIIQFLCYNPFDVDVESIGERIVILRKTLGLPRKKLARLLGVDPETVARWEKGSSVPAQKHINFLSSLHTSPVQWPSRVTAANPAAGIVALQGKE